MTLKLNRHLLDALPAIYQTSNDLYEILAIFESVLFGSVEQVPEKEEKPVSLTDSASIEKRISDISSFFDAYHTPVEFLPWLAQWVALLNLEGLNENQQRRLLGEIVPLYAQRGTKGYLKKLIEFFVHENETVDIDDEMIRGVVVGKTKLGINSWLQHERPFWFQVTIRSASMDNNEQIANRSRREKQIRRVIELSKPAHTMYELNWLV